MTAACRRTGLLRHFDGGEASKVSCSGTCDFCRDPKAVKDFIQARKVREQFSS